MSLHIVKLGDTIQIDGVSPSIPPAPTPPEMWNWLSQRGWVEYGDVEDFWKHEAKGRHSMRWEQAVACEFFEFITLGGR